MEFRLSFFALLFFLSCLVYFYWAVLVLRENTEDIKSKTYFALSLSVMVWSFGYGMSHISLDLAMALFWRQFATIGRIFFFALMLHFILLLGPRERKSKAFYHQLLLYLPSLLLVYALVFSPSLSAGQYQLSRVSYGWINKPTITIWNQFYYLYFFFYSFISVFLLIKWKGRVQEARLARQIKYIITAVVGGLALGVLIDFLPSVTLDNPLPQLASLFILLPMGVMYRAARHQQVFFAKIQPQEEMIVSQSQEKRIFQNVALVIVTSGLLIILSDLALSADEKTLALSISLQAALPLIVLGIALILAQRLDKKTSRDNLSVVLVLVSIPLVTLLFLDYHAAVAWALTLMVILGSILFTNPSLLVGATVMGIFTQLLVWFLRPSGYTVINKYNYVARLFIILAAYFIAAYIHSLYVANIKENKRKIRQQKVISRLSLDFVDVSRDNFPGKIEVLVKEMAQLLDLDRAYLLRSDQEGATLTNVHTYLGPSIEASSHSGKKISLEGCLGWQKRLTKEEIISFGDAREIEGLEEKEEEHIARQGVKSLLLAPLTIEGDLKALLVLETINKSKVWSQEEKEVVGILSNLLTRSLIQIEADKKIEYLAYYDSLTGLANRLLFIDRTSQAIELAKRTARCLAVIFVDIDNFKSINDTIGHTLGDELLCQVASRLKNSLRSMDTVARSAGDEFMLLINHIQDLGALEALVDKIMAIFHKPFYLRGQGFLVRVSAGLALYPTDGTDALRLLKNADLAMYEAKESGKNRCVICTDHLKGQVLTNMELSNDLYRALDEEELMVYYQPQIDLASQRMVGMEALLRWKHPTKGLVPPSVFIPIAEKNSLISPIGRWVFRQACLQQKRWQDMGLAPQTMAINLSSVQVIETGMAEEIEKIIQEVGLDPRYIELEITESMALRKKEEVVDIFKRFKDIGVSIAIDDFGTEHSSLSRLKLLPIDRIKIDMQFIQGLDHSEKDRTITKIMIGLAKDLGMNVLAEGVETASQLAFLEEKECDVVQGFFYYRPLASDQMEALLRREKRQEAPG